MKIEIFVMPAWIAGIHQVRKDASGNIHVNLDSSTPCWNDAIERALLEVPEVPLPRIFEGAFRFTPCLLFDSSPSIHYIECYLRSQVI